MRQKFFDNWDGYFSDTLWVKSFVEIAVLQFFAKNLKIQNGHQFGETQIF